MKLYNVHMLTPTQTWHNVEAKNESDAIDQVYIDPRIDISDIPVHFIAEEIEEEDIEEENIEEKEIEEN